MHGNVKLSLFSTAITCLDFLYLGTSVECVEIRDTGPYNSIKDPESELDLNGHPDIAKSAIWI